MVVGKFHPVSELTPQPVYRIVDFVDSLYTNAPNADATETPNPDEPNDASFQRYPGTVGRRCRHGANEAPPEPPSTLPIHVAKRVCYTLYVLAGSPRATLGDPFFYLVPDNDCKTSLLVSLEPRPSNLSRRSLPRALRRLHT